MKFFRSILYIPVIILFFAGCSGYHLSGYGSALPSYIRSIAIPVLKNSSSEPNIQKDATDAIRRAFISDGRLQVVNTRRAELLMRGTLTDYQLRAVSFNSEMLFPPGSLFLEMIIFCNRSKISKSLKTSLAAYFN